MLFRADERSRIYRHCNEIYAANCIPELGRFSDDSVMMWTGIHHDGHSIWMRIDGTLSLQIYLDEVLQHDVVPLINVTGGIFHHDDARPYTA